jgi:hypothetical protein
MVLLRYLAEYANPTSFVIILVAQVGFLVTGGRVYGDEFSAVSGITVCEFGIQIQEVVPFTSDAVLVLNTELCEGKSENKCTMYVWGSLS